MIRLCFGAAAVAVLLAMPATTAASPQAVVMHWTIDGVQRSALVFAPQTAGRRGQKHPLVFAFHGHGGHAGGTAMQMHIQALWPQAVVVYPQGLGTPTPGDPAGNLPGWQFKAGDQGDRDLKLFDAMVATLKAKYKIDAKRIYTTGFSNGGIFSYLLWSARAKTIAAVGEAAGRLAPGVSLSTPRALLAIAGMHDTTDPYADQLQSIDAAKQVDGATGAGTPCGLFCTAYASPGANKTPVVTILHPGAHVYPPGAPPRIVAFFKTHPQP